MIDRGPVTIGGHCGSCEHFRAGDKWDPPGFGQCLLGYSKDGNPDNPDTPVFAADMEQYKAKLMVKPHFGCTQWFAATNEALAERGVKLL